MKTWLKKLYNHLTKDLLVRVKASGRTAWKGARHSTPESKKKCLEKDRDLGISFVLT